MAIGPTSRPPVFTAAPAAAAPGRPARAANLREGDAERAESEAHERIVAAEKNVQAARNESEAQLDRLRDDFDHQAAAEQDRRQEALENERLKGYETLLDVQREQHQEISRIRREGERALAELSDHYRGQISQTDRDGAAELRRVQENRGNEALETQAASEFEVAGAKADHAARQERLLTDNQMQERVLREGATAELMRERASTAEAMQKNLDAFNEKYAIVRESTEQTLGDIGARANRELRQTRQDTSLKLDAYSRRQNDPFYRLVDVNAKLRETDDAYILTATIPPHERNHVSAAIKGESLVLSGYRRNEEKLALDGGRQKSTAAFQSFSESFPLPFPVDAKKLTREFDGDELTIRVPKKSGYLAPEARPVKPTPERVKLERPQFPQNLPVDAKSREEANARAREEDSNDPTEPRIPAPLPRAGRPLG